MRLGLACLALSAVVIAGALGLARRPGADAAIPAAAGEKLYCLSYAPFRGGQTPLDLATHISAAQIEDDLSRLAKITDCVRTYSVDFGLDQIAGIAARHGLKVMQGLWLSSHPDKNRDADRDRGRAGQPLSRHDPRAGGRQRGAAARRNVGRAISPPPSAR